MRGEVYEVQRKTKSQIYQYAQYVRRQLNIHTPYVDIVKIVEDIFPKFVPNYKFRVVNDDDDDVDMKDVLAYVEKKDEEITMYVREEIYNKALHKRN